MRLFSGITSKVLWDDCPTSRESFPQSSRAILRPSEQLLPLVYEELRRLAAQKMAQEKPGQTLQATALVHEAYLRLVDGAPVQRWESRGHFFAAAAEAMRRILVENARRKGRARHGGDLRREDFLDHNAGVDALPDEVLGVNEALAKLASEDPQAAEIVKLRYFAGLSVEDAARVLKLSRATAYRHWTYARAFIHCELFGE